MDHDTATRLQAAEQYVAGELPDTERDAFEEHFFECAECAEEVRWEQVFAANARAALQERPIRSAVVAAVPTRKTVSWFSLDWMRPAFAASAFANVLLLGVVGYGSLRLVPMLKGQLEQAEKPQLATAVAVPTVVRSEPKLIVAPASAHLVLLSFAVPHQFPQYAYEVIPEGGRGGFSEMTAAPGPDEELLVSVPTTHLEAGIYRVVLRGIDGSGRTEVGSCRLQVRH